MECGPLVPPVNGQVTLEKLRAVYSCNSGYNLNGENYRSCQSDENWSGVEPTCSSQNLATIIGLVVAFSVVLLILILLTVLVCRVYQYLKKEMEPPTMGLESIEFCQIKR